MSEDNNEFKSTHEENELEDFVSQKDEVGESEQLPAPSFPNVEKKKRSPFVVASLSFLAGAVVAGGAFYGGMIFSSRTTGANSLHIQSNFPVIATSGTGQNVISDIVKTYGSAVVSIYTESVTNSSSGNPLPDQTFGGSSSDTPQTNQALGSGFIISSNGYILTNQHVINNASTIQVEISGYDKEFTAKVIGQDPELDLAVIKVDAPKALPSLKLGDDTQVNVGDWAIAIGNPYGFDHSVTVGVVSAKGRPLSAENHTYKNLLQTDASINPGNSGGPLLNLKGEVIGINTAIDAQAQGIGFAIPSSTVKQVLDQLIKTGKVDHPWIGVSVQDITKDIADYYSLKEQQGVLVASVVANSPAQKAGIHQGDVILEVNKVKMQTADQLVSTISKMKIGDKPKLLIDRNGQLTSIVVTLEQKQEQPNTNQ